MRIPIVKPTCVKNPEKVPFKPAFPLKLQNRVAGYSKANTKEKTCLYEMSLLFACMKDNNFENKLCNQQIQNFQKCVHEFETHRKRQKELQQIGIPSPDTVQFTDSQITYMLRKYPTV